MKHLFQLILAAILFISGGAAAQDTPPQVNAAISPIKMNLLYIGVDNPMEIAVSDHKPEDITVRIQNGTITKDPKRIGYYHAKPEKVGEAVIIVGAIKDGKEIVLAEKQFRVRHIPTPYAVIGMNTSCEASKQWVLGNGGIRAYLETFSFDWTINITGFTLSDDKTGKSAVSHSGRFSAAQIKLIKSLPSGSKIFIEDIKAQDPSGYTYDLEPLTITLK